MIIGIGGCSNSGKSKLAEMIVNHYSEKNVSILCQDDYNNDEELIPKHYEHTDWELPETLNLERYLDAIKKASEENDILICEGIFTFWFDEICSLLDQRIYLELDKDEFLLRKAKDDRWGLETEWYIKHIWDSHLKYGMIRHENESNISINANSGVFDIEPISIVIDSLLKK